MQKYHLITTQTDLEHLCQQAITKDYIAVDTEFVRTRTLTPQLGLIQLYDGQQLSLIDPLAIDDLSSLKELLTNRKVVKVLHSCSEDLEAFWTHMQIMPQPIFDTQFAAGLAGMGVSLGYAALVQMAQGVQLDKGESRTDWLARPLTEQQLSYAANDVSYLYHIYPSLLEKITSAGREHWVFDEIQWLSEKKRNPLSPEYLYLNLKNNWQLRGHSLAILKELARWRVLKAQQLDLALNFVIKEPEMFSVAKLRPKSKAVLQRLVAPQTARKYSGEILSIVDGVQCLPPEMNPKKVERLVDFPAYKQLSAALRKSIEKVAEQQNIPVELLGSKKQINQMLKWLWFEMDESKLLARKPDLLRGWRSGLLTDEFKKVIPGLK